MTEYRKAKHKFIAITLCFIMLVITLVACGVSYDDDESKNIVAYVYAPNGKLIAWGDCEYLSIFTNNGRTKVTIDGVSYTTHISNIVIAEKEN